MSQDLIHRIALCLLPGIGCINAKKLVAYLGSVEAVFRQNERHLKKIPGIGENIARMVVSADVFPRAEKELAFIEKYGIRPVFYLDEEYPQRLLNCEDAPLMLFVKGDINFNNGRFIAMVGTRKGTAYGREFCNRFIAGLKEKNYQVTVVSGLAHGIDGFAHSASLKNQVPTIAILGHGLDTLYPAVHRKMAKDIINSGALVTEYMTDTIADKANFVKRNRIIAGMCDATIVVESGETGGALITAQMAQAYNRDVFAVPGRINDKLSEGCHLLLKKNVAAVITSTDDLEYYMGWSYSGSTSEKRPPEVFVNLLPEERSIYDFLSKNGDQSVDQISISLQMPVSKVTAMLFNLEVAGQIMALPGKMFRAH